MITVYFDGNCGLCNKEINFYRKITKSNPSLFNWANLHEPEILRGESFTKTEAMEILHVKGSDNQIYKGVYAFIVIWKNIKYMKWLCYLSSIPPITFILKVLYRLFCLWRSKQIKTCNF